MQLSDTIIQQYLQGKLPVKDAKLVAKLLDENPEWPNQYFNEDEWQQLAAVESLGNEKLKDTLTAIQAKAYQTPQRNRAKVIYMTIAAASVAAAVILFVYVGGLLPSGKSVKTRTASVYLSNDTITQQNNSDTVQHFALEDGSAIELSPKSLVAYLKKFPANQRLIRLTGSAFFNVAKDKKRPFEVQSAGFSTIALGTSFKVTAKPYSQLVTVQLFTGKVLVKQTEKVSGFKGLVLNPNEQVTINTNSLAAQVTLIDQNNSKPPALKAVQQEALAWNDYLNDSQIKFNNTPLTDVFKVLEHQYNVSILYSPAQVKDMVFTGTFKIADQPQSILYTITTINNLKLLKGTDNHFKITR